MYTMERETREITQEETGVPLLVHLPAIHDVGRPMIGPIALTAPKGCTNTVQLYDKVSAHLKQTDGNVQLPPLHKLDVCVQDWNNPFFSCNAEVCAPMVTISQDVNDLISPFEAWQQRAEDRALAFKRTQLLKLLPCKDLEQSACVMERLVAAMNDDDLSILQQFLNEMAEKLLCKLKEAGGFQGFRYRDKRRVLCRVLATLHCRGVLAAGWQQVAVMMRLMKMSSSMRSACPARPYVDLLCYSVMTLRQVVCSCSVDNTALVICEEIIEHLLGNLLHGSNEEVVFLSLLAVEALAKTSTRHQLVKLSCVLVCLVRCPRLLLDDPTMRHGMRTVSVAMRCLALLLKTHEALLKNDTSLLNELVCNGFDIHLVSTLVAAALGFIRDSAGREERSADVQQKEKQEEWMFKQIISLYALIILNRAIELHLIASEEEREDEEIRIMSRLFQNLAGLATCARKRALSATISEDDLSFFKVIEVLALTAISAVIRSRSSRFRILAGLYPNLLRLSHCTCGNARKAVCAILLSAGGEHNKRIRDIGVDEVLQLMVGAEARSKEKFMLAHLVTLLFSEHASVSLQSIRLIVCAVEKALGEEDYLVISPLCHAICSGLRIVSTTNSSTASATEQDKKEEEDCEEGNEALTLNSRATACLMKIVAGFLVNVQSVYERDMLHVLDALCCLVVPSESAIDFVLRRRGDEILTAVVKTSWERQAEVCSKSLGILRCLAEVPTCATAMAKPEMLETLFALATRVDAERVTKLPDPRVARLAASVLLAVPFPLELSESCYIALVKTFLFLRDDCLSQHIFGTRIFAKINFSPIGYKILRQQGCIAKLVSFACDQIPSPNRDELLTSASAKREVEGLRLRRSNALLALAYCVRDKTNQIYLTQKALDKLLILVWTSDAKHDHQLVALILAQVNGNKSNRTRIYKAEMKAKELCHFYARAQASMLEKQEKASRSPSNQDIEGDESEDFQHAVIRHAKPFLDAAANPSLAVKSNRMTKFDKHSLVHKLRLSTKMMWKRLEYATDQLHSNAPSWSQPVYKDKIFEASRSIPASRACADLEASDLIDEAQRVEFNHECFGTAEVVQEALSSVEKLEQKWNDYVSDQSLCENIIQDGLHAPEPLQVPTESMPIVLRLRRKT